MSTRARVGLLPLLLLAITGAAPAAPAPTALTTVSQHVRAMGHLGAPILETLPPGQRVTLRARLPDNSWVAVTTPHQVKGWMYRPYLEVADQTVQALPAVGQDFLLDPQTPQGDAMPGMPPAAPTTRPS